MIESYIDVRGKACPIPLIETKKLYDKIEINDKIEVISDNLISTENVKRFIEESGGKVRIFSDNGEWKIIIEKIITGNSKEAELFCEIESSTQNKYIIYIKSEFMGNGDEDLGRILIKGFINTIEEMETLPTHIIFVNGAVKISTENSSETETLKKLEEKGVKVLSCGTCLNFFELSEKLEVGIASNMFDIMKILTESPQIVTP